MPRAKGTPSASPTAPSASEWTFCSIAEITNALQSRRRSALELLEHVLARIEALDPRLNAVVVRDFDRARTAAKAADVALGRGDRRPLLGIPVTQYQRQFRDCRSLLRNHHRCLPNAQGERP